MVNYQPSTTLLQAQSPLPLIPNRTGLIKLASPVRARDNISHLLFLTLQSGEETEKAARNTIATGSMEAQEEESKIESHLVETHE